MAKGSRFMVATITAAGESGALPLQLGSSRRSSCAWAGWDLLGGRTRSNNQNIISISIQTRSSTSISIRIRVSLIIIRLNRNPGSCLKSELISTQWESRRELQAIWLTAPTGKPPLGCELSTFLEVSWVVLSIRVIRVVQGYCRSTIRVSIRVR